MKYLLSILCLFISSFIYSATINIPENYPIIQEGINAATAGDTIFVSTGTYSPETGEHFPIIMISNINLIGEDEETTILDAQQTGSVIAMDNCENNTISNLTITGGAGTNGGGMLLLGSDPLLKHITITNNTSYSDGAGMYLDESNPLLSHITISHNVTNNIGGGMYLKASNPTLTHVTIAYNMSGEGQGISLYNSSPTLTNSIIYWNTHCHDGWCHDSIYLVGDENEPTITYNNIEGGWFGEGNIDFFPLFTNPENADFTLQAGSPCIDAGTIIEGIEYFGVAPDMGAYEYGSGTQDLLIGDLNGDGLLNVIDIVALVYYVLSSSNYNSQMDLNEDEFVNVVDIVALVNLILNS